MSACVVVVVVVMVCAHGSIFCRGQLLEFRLRKERVRQGARQTDREEEGRRRTKICDLIAFCAL